jgi:membrane peptidoglycan carboxypeptidase
VVGTAHVPGGRHDPPAVGSSPIINRPPARPGNEPGPNEPGPNQPGPDQPGPDQPGPNLRRRSARRRTALRRLRTGAIVSVLLAVLAGMTAWGYVASVDMPPDPVPPQASVLYYRDGRTVLARIGTTDRTDVPLSAVPQDVRNAFLAAEDRDFYGHVGLSARGVLRALWVNLTDGDAQGASTITQQYVRNAYLSLDRNLSRKMKEAALSLKVERRFSKDEILEKYLNTIYFGRGAYGIQSAAQAYFGTTVDRLTGVQGAVLATLIKDPYGNDPSVDAQRAQDRWRWILRAMAVQGWMDSATAESAAYPKVAVDSVTRTAIGGPLGVITDRVEEELKAARISAQTIRTAGLQVVTTIDATAQKSAMSVLAKALKGQPKQLRAALVAVDPQSGGIRAYYGGDRGRGFFDDAAAARPAASTFKPIVLAAAEQQGIGFTSLWDGGSPRIFKDRQGVPLRNRRDLQCPVCPLGIAMEHSLNTPFYAVAERIGPSRVRDLAVAMGIPQKYGKQRTLVDLTGEPTPGRTRADIALGRYAVTPADLATVYGTFAAGGRRAERFLVESVKGADGTDWHAREPRHKRVLDAGIAADVSAVLSQVVTRNGEVPGHQASAKTGTQQWGDSGDSSDAWTAGYLPQLAAVTWIGRAEPGAVRDAAGRVINGDGLPYRVWKDFMAGALKGQRPVPLQRPEMVGSPDAGDAVGPFSMAGLVMEDGDKRMALVRQGQWAGPGGDASAADPRDGPGTGPSTNPTGPSDGGRKAAEPQVSPSFPVKPAR